MSITIDSHQHFWDLTRPFDHRWLDAPDKAPIRRDFLPEHLLPHLEVTHVRYSVFVQTQHDLEENRWAFGLAERHPFIAGVVGWVDLSSPACEEQLLEARRHPKFVGVRHVTQDEPDDDFIVRPEVLAGLAVLQKHDVPFDLLFYPRHLVHVPTLARRLPGLRMVIDHLGKPGIRNNAFSDWLPAFRAGAAFPNVSCKLSGLVTEADPKGWTPDGLRPYVRAAIDLFGPDRCMFGSDWPVCELAASYGQVHAALVEALGPMTEDDRAKVFGGTARRFYRLPLEGS
jgi:L-fuconolactonase